MSLDINAAIQQMLNAMKTEAAGSWDKIKDASNSFLQGHKLRLKQLADQRLNNEIDDDFLKARLQDEQDILKAEIVSEKILAEAAAEKIINSAFAVLENTIMNAL
jgi:hypothetical protein